MTDIRNLYKLVVEMEQKGEDESIQLHDSFDIELNEHFVIETGVVGFTHDGVIVEADEKTLEFLEINDVLLESEEHEMLSENPALMALGRAAAMGFGSQMGDRVADKFGLEETDELEEIKRLSAIKEGSSDGVYNAVIRRIMNQHLDVLEKFGPKAVMTAVDDLAHDLDDLDEIGSSDVSIWTKQVIQDLESGMYSHLHEAPGDFTVKTKSAADAFKQHTNTGSKEHDVPKDPKTGKTLYQKVQGLEEEELDEAEYQGRKVPLGKPMKGDVKKSKVYVRKPNGKVVKVNFGDKNMRIKKNIPGRRKNFRARHNCDNPGPRWKARYWSCRAW